MTPLPPCFPESGIAPQAFSQPLPDDPTSDLEEYLPRLEETAKDEVVWEADRAAHNRLADSESLPLEMRGLTSHPPKAPSKRQAKLSQAEFWKKQTIHKFAVASKLRQVGEHELAAKLENCHSYYTVATCGDCGTVRKFPNRCDLFFCPECAHHLQNERERQVKWWAVRTPQPKHLVLTIKNIIDLTAAHIDEFRRMFTKLRRSKFARNWKGGFYRIEITNDGNGWHIHLHALVNARWIDQDGLKENWRRITNGLGYIVRVKDTRQESYLHEVTKYVVKGSQLAAWQPEQINTFIASLQGKRTFGVFGELYGARTEFAEWIAGLKQAKPRCQCGSINVHYQTEHDWLISQHTATRTAAPRPPPPPDQQRQLFRIPIVWPD